mmetsp:Transcript_22680/g.47570  ORF Transcript_22680/g.47570 Transcript_22680/m.47570 type:complete len:823 (-) Transcript_22680:80-2548(-)
MVARASKRSSSGGVKGNLVSEFYYYESSNQPNDGGDVVVLYGTSRCDGSEYAPPKTSTKGESTKEIQGAAKSNKNECLDTSNTKQKTGKSNANRNQSRKNEFQQRGKKVADENELNQSNRGCENSGKSHLERIESKCEETSKVKKNNQRRSRKQSIRDGKVPKVTVLKRDGAGARYNCVIDDVQSKCMPQQSRRGRIGPKKSQDEEVVKNPELDELDQTKKIVSALRDELQNLRSDYKQQLSELEGEMKFEHSLRMTVQDEHEELNDIIFEERSKIGDLEAQLKGKETEKDDLAKIIADVTEQLNEEYSLRDSMRADLLSSMDVIQNLRNKVKELEKKFNNEAAAKVSVMMELQSTRVQFERVSLLKEELTMERSKNAQQTKASEELSSVKEELLSAKERVTTLEELLKTEKVKTEEAKSIIRELTHKIETRDNYVPIKKEIYLGKLRSELRDTQQKLKAERKKAAQNSTRVSKGHKERPFPEKLSLSDWVDVVNIRSGVTPMIMPRAVEASLPTPSTSERASLVNFESAPVHYDGVESDVVDDEGNPLEDELAFIRSAYSSDEISISENKITYKVQLPMEDEAELIKVDVVLSIPKDYPASGVLDVECNICRSSSCSPEVRRCAIDALPNLMETLTWEAKAGEGSEALLSIFTVAESWTKNDWHGIVSAKILPAVQSKRRTGSDLENGCFEICTALIHSHHIVEVDTIQMAKKIASKLSLGGYMKTGRPGLMLVEGTEADCHSLVELIILGQKKARNRCKSVGSSYFKLANKVVRSENDLNAGRKLPRKMQQLESSIGMDELKAACEKMGLAKALSDILLD